MRRVVIVVMANLEERFAVLEKFKIQNLLSKHSQCCSQNAPCLWSHSTQNARIETNLCGDQITQRSSNLLTDSSCIKSVPSNKDRISSKISWGSLCFVFSISWKSFPSSPESGSESLTIAMPGTNFEAVWSLCMGVMDCADCSIFMRMIQSNFGTYCFYVYLQDLQIGIPSFGSTATKCSTPSFSLHTESVRKSLAETVCGPQ